MSKKNQNKSKKAVNDDVQPLMVSQASSNREYEAKASDYATRSRRNLAGNITRT